jgi:hypothetical protein
VALRTASVYAAFPEGERFTWSDSSGAGPTHEEQSMGFRWGVQWGKFGSGLVMLLIGLGITGGFLLVG